jgi:hypothetical protein
MLTETTIRSRAGLFALLALWAAYAPGTVMVAESNRIKKELVVIKTTEDRAEAMAAASQAATKLGYQLNLRGLSENDKLGLSHTKEFCENKGWSHPCITPRAWSNDGVYVSVDRNFYYTEFDKGMYIVTVATGDPGDKLLGEVLQKVQQLYPSSFARLTTVTTEGVWR